VRTKAVSAKWLAAVLVCSSATASSAAPQTQVLTFELWLAKAERGDASAQYIAGFMYVRGQGVAQNLPEAARWLRASAEQGNANAQWSLGTLYELGFGVPKDYAEAFRLYGLAAPRGVAEAQSSLGLYYLEGLGTERNYGEAYRWLRSAARQGLKEAQLGLGRMYENGLGVPHDLVRAYMWYSLPVETSTRNTPSQQRDALAKKLTQDDIERAQAMARACLQSNFSDCN